MTEWIAFYNLSPFGDDREDVRNAINSCVTANCFSKSKKRIADFLPEFKRRSESNVKQQTPEQMKAIFEDMRKFFNG